MEGVWLDVYVEVQMELEGGGCVMEAVEVWVTMQGEDEVVRV